MKTPMHKRPIPDGFQLDWDTSIWNVGHVFQWSEVWKKFACIGTVTVKPNEDIAQSLERLDYDPLNSDIEVFFQKG